MLNIEVIKFEAQDVITASGVCQHKAETTVVIEPGKGANVTWKCTLCGATGDESNLPANVVRK